MFIKFFASTDVQGSTVSEVVEYDDGTPEAEIEDDWKEWRNGMVDMGWYRCSADGEPVHEPEA